MKQKKNRFHVRVNSFSICSQHEKMMRNWCYLDRYFFSDYNVVFFFHSFCESLFFENLLNANKEASILVLSDLKIRKFAIFETQLMK